MVYICSLNSDKECKYLLKDCVHCAGNPACAFCVQDGTRAKAVAYERKPRRYEKYYK